MSFFKNKRVLVTGAAGLIGQSTVNSLLEKGALVKATVYNRPLNITHPYLQIVKCDLMDIKQCEYIVNDVDIIINSAAYVAGAGRQKTDPTGLVRNNLIPAVNITDASVRRGVDIFVSVGSSTMYPDVTYPVKEEEGFSDEPFKGYEGVGLVKRFLEKSFLHYSNISNTKFVLTRTTAVYGANDNFHSDKAHVIPDTIMKAVKQVNPYYVWGDGSAIRDFVYVEDFVEGMLLCIEHGIYNDPINIATGVPTSVKELVETATDICGYKPEIIFDPTKPTAIPIRLVNIDKSKRLLNWKCSTDLRTGLEKTINWYKKNIKL